MSLSRNSLILLQSLLHAQQLSVGADLAELEAVLRAKEELAAEIAATEPTT